MSAADVSVVGLSHTVFQDANLYPWLTAADNVAFPLALRGIRKAEGRERANAMLKLVGLDGFASRFPHEPAWRRASAEAGIGFPIAMAAGSSGISSPSTRSQTGSRQRFLCYRGLQPVTIGEDLQLC